ncbi:MAG: beta-lactamase family protein, partial [Bacteroidales bacterium]|nr:beta-lactamase family protein [Bacteroidales bacterium]
MKRIVLSAVMAIAVLTSAAPADNGLKHVKPESVGMDASRLALIDSVINAALEQGAAPGAVVAVVKDDKVVFEKAYGYRQLVPSREVMTVGTQFDLASLSKCVGTTISIMQLIEQGKLRLTDEVKMYLPDFAPWEDVDITIRDLMTHT